LTHKNTPIDPFLKYTPPNPHKKIQINLIKHDAPHDNARPKRACPSKIQAFMGIKLTKNSTLSGQKTAMPIIFKFSA
jgi:hypothetical protein